MDDHSRLVYSEILADERKETAAGFWQRARAFFAQAGFEVKAVMTDNSSCYRSHTFAQALGHDISHRRTRPYRPQTNGKESIERFQQTMKKWLHGQPAQPATLDQLQTLLDTLNRPGVSGESFRWKDLCHGTSLEVPA